MPVPAFRKTPRPAVARLLRDRVRGFSVELQVAGCSIASPLSRDSPKAGFVSKSWPHGSKVPSPRRRRKRSLGALSADRNTGHGPDKGAVGAVPRTGRSRDAPARSAVFGGCRPRGRVSTRWCRRTGWTPCPRPGATTGSSSAGIEPSGGDLSVSLRRSGPARHDARPPAPRSPGDSHDPDPPPGCRCRPSRPRVLHARRGHPSVLARRADAAAGPRHTGTGPRTRRYRACWRRGAAADRSAAAGRPPRRGFRSPWGAAQRRDPGRG